MNLRGLKGKKLTEPDFWEKSHFGDNAQKHPTPRKKKSFFRFFLENSPLMCRFFGFKSCIIITFMILLKPHVWEKSGSRVKYKNALSQSD